MKIVFIFLISLSVFAADITVQILSPCDGSIAHEKKQNIQFDNLGQASVHFLDQMQLPYSGNDYSITSILETPTGMDAYDITSDNDMRAYGWCYSVNGESPELMPNQYLLDDNKDYVISWHYGFALYKDGQWITQCTPSWSVMPNFVCY
jgi:hypothetical protein